VRRSAENGVWRGKKIELLVLFNSCYVRMFLFEFVAEIFFHCLAFALACFVLI